GLGNVYNSLVRYQEAISYYEQSLEIRREIGNRRGVADSLNGLGEVYDALENYQQALSLYQEALTIATEIKSPQYQAEIWFNFGKTLTKLNRIPDAMGAYRNARQFYQQMQLDHKIQECDRALEQLETPPIPPSPTRWQKIRRWFSQIKQFFRQLFS
ncbi:tetratricopeptide repeat protein, partial [Planktothrix mougeotii]